MNPLGIADLLRMAEEDKQAVIAEAEARGYARGVEDAARWHDNQATALTGLGTVNTKRAATLHESHAACIRSLAERTANDASPTGHASNAGE